jgi:hypothetical protein
LTTISRILGASLTIGTPASLVFHPTVGTNVTQGRTNTHLASSISRPTTNTLLGATPQVHSATASDPGLARPPVSNIVQMPSWAPANVISSVPPNSSERIDPSRKFRLKPDFLTALRTVEGVDQRQLVFTYREVRFNTLIQE